MIILKLYTLVPFNKFLLKLHFYFTRIFLSIYHSLSYDHIRRYRDFGQDLKEILYLYDLLRWPSSPNYLMYVGNCMLILKSPPLSEQANLNFYCMNNLWNSGSDPNICKALSWIRIPWSRPSRCGSQGKIPNPWWKTLNPVHYLMSKRIF